jgi:SAM-dependent methyltransferase
VVGSARKQLGAWYTPPDLVDAVVEQVITSDFVAGRTSPLAVLDPACGDGRFLLAAQRRLDELGVVASLTGVDLDAAAIDTARALLPAGTELRCADALATTWDERRFDLVLGNPPFLSQMAATTTRGGSSPHGGGPYADAAAEFLALAGSLVDPTGGRVALVLPQSLLASRDATAIRRSIGEHARMVWSWWSPRRLFDAQVHVCVVAFEFGSSEPIERRANWSHVATSRQGVPLVPDSLRTDGCLGDRARLNANFRDEYYGMIPAVGDHATGPPLITSGLIDPGRSWWGERPITFARHRYQRPRVDLDRLDEDMRRWARRRLVPKVLVANQTRIAEAVCDPTGDWLPAVPVLGVYPTGAHWDDGHRRRADDLVAAAWEIAAVLTSSVASAWLWHRGAGTGLSADAIRLSPVTLGALPWPAGPLDRAVEALRHGDTRGCSAAVSDAYGIAEDALALERWWTPLLQRIEARHPSTA